MKPAGQITVFTMPSALNRWSSVTQLWRDGEMVVEVTVPRNQEHALLILAHMFHMEVLESREDNELARQVIADEIRSCQSQERSPESDREERE